jgi:membrane-bound serine protease (ClpP class)
MLSWLAAAALLLAGTAFAADETPTSLYRIVVDGPISPATDDFISSAIERASTDGAAALVIELDTPGGLLESTKSIVKNVLAAPIPVVVYVSPGGASATSAGVFITLAAHVAAMAPGTTIGAAHPVTDRGGDIEGDMRQKVENFAASLVESLARRRGRNVEWAVKAVRESVSITEAEALEKKVVDVVAASLKELVKKTDGREVEVAGTKLRLELSKTLGTDGEPRTVDVPMTLRQKVLSIITDPNIAYLLMMAGMLGLYFEFSTPGAVFPGVAGAICLLLALLAGQVLPINSTGVLLILLGMSFFVAELFLPSFGMLGVGGIIALTLGSLFLYAPDSNLRVDRSLIAATALAFGSALLGIMFLLVRDRRRRPMTGAEGLVDEVGVAMTSIHADGKVKVHGELWNATSSEPIEARKRVRVESVSGLRVRVREETEK